ncbi:dUTP diphosphatase [Staphylococcus warneri]|uniref:dUTP diphosphatase n=1 Tax=Staphylococcus warneri TaxID=1292 RepID=UPI003CEAB0D1
MTNQLEIKLLSDDATLPTRERLDAGYDIYSAETLILEPQEKAVIKTDVAVNIPEGYVGLLTSRSGISSKTHLVIETGKIDAGYQGNLGINIKNDIGTLQDEYETIKDKNGNDISVYITKNIKGEKTNGCHSLPNTYIVHEGDKLAQLVIVPIWTPALKQVDEFHTESERGTDGFGSTGY